MAPPIVWICLFGYLTIGLFFMGLLHDDPGTDAWVVLLWPFIIVEVVFFFILDLPYWLGCKVSDLIIKIKNRGDE